MTQPLNLNTILPMSLEVNRLQQLQHSQPADQQGLISQQQEIDNKEKQEKINEKEGTEGARIDADGSNENSSQQEDTEGETEENEVKSNKTGKGSYIDVKV